jgi:hypothetical protein
MNSVKVDSTLVEANTFFRSPTGQPVIYLQHTFSEGCRDYSREVSTLTGVGGRADSVNDVSEGWQSADLECCR